MDYSTRLFWVAGPEQESRRRNIETLKSRILGKNPDSFACASLYCGQIKEGEFEEECLSFSFGKNKIIILRDFLALPAKLKDKLTANLEKILLNSVLIIESAEDFSALQRDRKITSDKPTVFLLKNCKKIPAGGRNEFVSLGALRWCLEKGDWEQVFYITARLLEGGPWREKEMGPQIIGLVNSLAGTFSDKNKKSKYIECLWEADRAMKEKGLSVNLALQMMLVKLKQYA